MHNTIRQARGINPGGMNAFSTPTVSSSSSGRGRSQRVCEMCSRKKTKCEIEGSQSVCVPCTRRGSQCVFPGAKSVPVSQQEEQRNEYVLSLKTRLEKIETLLEMAGVLPEGTANEPLDEDGDDDGSQYDYWEPSHPRNGSLENASHLVPDSSEPSCPAIKDPAGGDLEGMSLFKMHESDDPRFLGRSSSLSLLSRGGIEWIKNKTGDLGFLRVLSTDSVHDSPWGTWRPDVFHDLFASQVYRPLPSRSEVFSLIGDYFRSVNRLFPIFHEGSFMKMIEWQYTQQTCDDAARWACLNMVICLAYEYRYSNSLKPEKDRDKARMYFKNAMSVFTELALRRTDLLSVQALLSMAFFLRGNSGTQSAMPLTTAAMRSCQRMGLHRNIQRPDLSPSDQEQRRRVFWVAFSIDQSTCLRAGNAPSQHPDDFDVPLPETIEDDKLNPDTAININFFRQMCRMSLIKCRIFCRLYTAKALVKPPQEIYKIVKELHAELEECRKAYPLDMSKQSAAQSDFLFGFGVVGLRLVYYNALIMIHRIPLVQCYLISNREESEELRSLSEARASKSAVICVVAARDTLKLINTMPWGDIAWIWSLLYYVFTAAATIFSSILRDCRHPSVHDDLNKLNMAATFFTTLTPGDGPNHYAGFMTRMTTQLERIARSFVVKHEKRARSPDSRENANLPSSKRHTPHTTTSSRSRPRHRPTSLRTSLNNDGTASYHQPTNNFQRNSNPSATASSYMADFGIPESIEGLPPVNSSGYVVPLSPAISEDNPSSSTQPAPAPATTSTHTGLNLNNNSPDLNAMTWNQPQSQPLDQMQTINSSPMDTTQSPFSQTSAQSTFIPESWQIPLTADWEYGDNLWSGLFPSEAIAAAGTAQEIPMPILSSESFLSHPNPSLPNDSQQPINPELPFGTDTMNYNHPTPAGQGPIPEPDFYSSSFLGLF